MISDSQIRIESDDGITLLQKYNKRLRSLILTPVGTMIGNRDFGISIDLVDMAPQQAANYLAMELEKKIPLFIPEIGVKSVEWTSDGTGKATFIIHIGVINK